MRAYDACIVVEDVNPLVANDRRDFVIGVTDGRFVGDVDLDDVELALRGALELVQSCCLVRVATRRDNDVGGVLEQAGCEGQTDSPRGSVRLSS